jgi:ABC-2 type transport system ATP-binding protein
VLLSSHILSEVEALCDRLTIVRDGRVVERGTLDDLRHLARTAVQAEVSLEVPGLRRLSGVHDLAVGPGRPDTGERRVTFDVDPSGLDEAMALLSAAGLRSLTCRPPSLEELFLRHYQGSAHAAEVSS